ncbi:glutathione peroxidase [Nitrospirillum sp. BR 11828]|uniref:glutathione peroxidase n=1 Tax=Nitrospirillum sp. BR 11828 TaxID=3104325 RepID=UPI002ACA5C0F|nr:glutathione peroxidase [Nitrospirillum sp. BR 11828]MDZ5647766.1 glutathione peroxidase [Nitrospirillum sp. BR 11828]
MPASPPNRRSLIRGLAIAALALAGMAATGLVTAQRGAAAAALPSSAAGSAYDYKFTSIDGEPLPLSQFKGKAILVVNTASLCGFTPQYKGLEALYTAYKDKGLVVLGVPANDFLDQEPGSNKEIKHFCESTFAIDFPMTEKEVVTGDKAHPFYKWVSAAKGAPKWNFHKYLISPEGALIAAFPSRVEPESPELKAAINAALPHNG